MTQAQEVMTRAQEVMTRAQEVRTQAEENRITGNVVRRSSSSLISPQEQH